ncbi:uncharacterized protein LOC119725620 [Patiria miniata]|uniref:Uncharacterized protein n=1 Tax=Patiria miniata TaxID=46514 RepID=A0A913ZMQ4_PATMI|nr:uncharacterized protein LOC119725620 [Patiria miniata]
MKTNLKFVRMYRTMEKESLICGLVAVAVMFACVAEAGTIKRGASDSAFNKPLLTPEIIHNAFSGNGKNDHDSISINHSGQIPSNTNADNSQGIPSGNWQSGDVSLLQSGSGSGQQASETSTTGKRAAGPHGNRHDLPARAICPFEYVKDENTARRPAQLMVAKATPGSAKCLDPNSGKPANQGSCVIVNYSIQVQMNNTGSWRDETIEIAVARVCVLDKED